MAEDKEPELSDGSEIEKPKREGLGKTFGLVAVLSFLSKFFGLARDMIILSAFGAAADAFYYASMFTGNILVLFGGLGGPYHSTAVSILSSRKEKEGVSRLTGQLLSITFAALSFIAIAIAVFAPQIVSIVIPGNELSLAERQKVWSEVVPLIRIMSPMVVIAGLVGVGAGISNSYKEFFWPSLSPAVANVAIIIVVLYYQFFGKAQGFDLEGGLSLLAIGALIGAFGQLAVQIPGILRAHPTFSLKLEAQPGLREFLFMLGPAAIATTVGQINYYIDAFFVSNLEQGSITAITNANKLLQLPLGVLLTAMLVPILPRFTEQVAAGEHQEMKQELSRSTRIVWFLVIPLATMLLALPGPIIKLLFQRGQFDQQMSNLMMTALLFLVPQAFFYIPRDLFTRAFYAHQDSKTPFQVGACAIAVKAIANYVLVGMMNLGVGGITLSTTLVTIFNMTLLGALLRKRLGNLGITKLIRPAVVMLLSATAAGFLAHYCQIFIVNVLNLPGKLGGLIVLAFSIATAGSLGLALYAGICLLFKLEEPQQALKTLKRSSLFKRIAGKGSN